MARILAAAVLVCAALLLCVGQSAGSLGSNDPLSTLFPAGSLPPPLWWQLYPLPSILDGEGPNFWLVNVATKQAIVSPIDGSWEVKLAPFNPWDKAQLWKPDRPDADGFYQIKVFDDQSKALNGLGGNVHDRMVIGIYPDNPVSPNTLWNLTSIWPFPFHFFP
ncbi:hypothetical protein BAE44_0007033 [Dichanthelium oligosanthes]|uniref:Ricin B lectin domain-containing protein n=1 Tax=Dichanthelium oligosanthes TaxID=888268 RepID=A0A1E5W3T8_9POAL|nr:hypothetical protein BAE44_0007033 [Dichanthelium oligosanthes]